MYLKLLRVVQYSEIFKPSWPQTILYRTYYGTSIWTRWEPLCTVISPLHRTLAGDVEAWGWVADLKASIFRGPAENTKWHSTEMPRAESGQAEMVWRHFTWAMKALRDWVGYHIHVHPIFNPASSYTCLHLCDFATATLSFFTVMFFIHCCSICLGLFSLHFSS